MRQIIRDWLDELVNGPSYTLGPRIQDLHPSPPPLIEMFFSGEAVKAVQKNGPGHLHPLLDYIERFMASNIDPEKYTTVRDMTDDGGFIIRVVER